MSKAKRNYILFKFTKFYSETSYSWKPTYFSKGGLVHQIAITEFYSDDSKILKNLADSMEEIEAKYKYVKSTYSWIGGYLRQINSYYIAKVNSGIMRKVEVSELEDLIKEEYMLDVYAKSKGDVESE